MRTVEEGKFRQAVKTLLERGRYPDHGMVCDLVGVGYTHSGFTTEQTRWRKEEIESAGYDFEESKRTRRLIRKS